MSEVINSVGSSLQSNSTSIHEAEQAFRQSYPIYESTSLLDELRATQYSRLDRHRHIYLDYTGGGLYAESQLREHMELLRNNVFGNPHSLNPTSRNQFGSPDALLKRGAGNPVPERRAG